MAASTALMAVGFTGCSIKDSPALTAFGGASAAAPSTTHSTPRAPAADFSGLLIRPGDLSNSEDSYTAQPPTANPQGMNGVTDLFTNHDDTRAIGDTILVFPDPAAAAAALDQAVPSVAKSVSGDGAQPSAVGTGGTVVSGYSPDGSKAVTVLMFGQGRALVRLEFDSAPGDPTSSQLVTDVAQKQDIAVRTGLSSP